MILEELGIVGWQDIEQTLLSALVSDNAILFIGRHGTNKTNGFRQIAKALLGEGAKTRRYNTPTLQIDDFLGYLDPSALAEGEIRYINTDMSIWEAQAALFDEISRSSPATTNKLLEAVWEKTVHGLKTELRLVMTTMNPPGEYHSMYLDPALASRFVCIHVPDSKDMSDEDLTKVIGFRLRMMNSAHHVVTPTLKDLVDNARRVTFSERDRNQTTEVVKKIIAAIHDKTNVYYSVRQAQIAASMLEASEAIRIAANEMGLAPNWGVNGAINLVLATVPDSFGIVKGSNAGLQAQITSAINDILIGYECKDPLVMANSLDELIAAEHPDTLIHAAAICRSIESETDPDKIQDAIIQLKATTKFEPESLRGMMKVAFSSLVDTKLTANPNSAYAPSQIVDILKDAYTNDGKRTGIASNVTDTIVAEAAKEAADA